MRRARLNAPLDPARMERFLRSHGITGPRFKIWAGCGIREWIALNPTWTERRFEELVLENLETLKEKPPTDRRGKRKGVAGHERL